MKRKVKSPLPKDLQKALDSFPAIVAANRARYFKKQRFIEKTFGDLARKVRRQVAKQQTERLIPAVKALKAVGKSRRKKKDRKV